MLPVRRPDPNYSQASARYLNLIAEGAREHDLPGEYQEYLGSLTPYRITTRRQAVGRLLFLSFWGLPFVAFIILGWLFRDKKTGRAPPWMIAVTNVLFNLVWLSYDHVAKPLRGTGKGRRGRAKI